MGQEKKMTKEQYAKLVDVGRQIAVGWLIAGGEGFRLNPEYEFAEGDFELVKGVCEEALGIDLCEVVDTEIWDDVWDAVRDGYREVVLEEELVKND